ncbi:hypothetical protein I302_108489 [Kwoniella bestiolae CBS 10118]|uniref:SET domain-containing protein n=1 Tax=Kwoniella bestiolae CBS 10118 TaxID=1296100 RepID=A0A1B9FVK0_9TREE|nr:hypothetical protein I302_07135 [Kwoniella bestiolae CBS 10118]OCF22794.1 hypothetical protein I302_07135 [Kwoniella bestiolae CBS 10118]
MSSFQDLKKTRTARQKGKSTGPSNPSASGKATYTAEGSHYSITGTNMSSDMAQRINRYMSKVADGNEVEADTPDLTKYENGEIDQDMASRAKSVLSNLLGRPLGEVPGEVPVDTDPSSSALQRREKEHSVIEGKGKVVRQTGLDENGGKSRRDQVSHELYGKELDDNGLEVHNISGRGRGLMSTRSVKPGTVILKTPPSISALQNQHFQRVCHGCYLTMKESNIARCKDEKERFEKKMRGLLKVKLNRCSGCKVLHYCSRECQLSDWPTHKHECIALQRFRRMYYKTYPTKRQDDDDLSWTHASPEPVRALARIIWKRRVEREKNGGEDGIWWKQIASLETHVSRSPEKEVMRLAQQAQHLQHYLSASIPVQGSGGDEDQLLPVNMEDFGFGNVHEMMSFCSSFHVNSFTLSSPSLSPIGVSNSPLMALSNHSCDPNAIVVFPNGGKLMELVAIRDIQTGEEILTSYIDLSCPYDIRQRDLQERYRFSCDCTLCEKSKDGGKSDWVDPRWCVRHDGCRNGDGKGKMPDKGSISDLSVKCDSCLESFTVNAREVLAIVQKGVDVLDSDEHRQLDYKTAQKTLSTLIPSLQKYIPNHSYPLLSLLRLSTLSHTPPQSPQDMEIALRHISEAYEACDKVYHQNHAIPTLILCEYAKLLSLQDSEQPRDQGGERKNEMIRRLLRATELLKRAVGQGEISFGRGNVVGKELEGVLEGCREEWERLKRR